MPRGKNRFQARGHAARGRVIALKPFSVRLDRNEVEVEHAANRMFGAARLVEAEVPVLAKPQHDDVQAAKAANAALVFLNACQCFVLR